MTREEALEVFSTVKERSEHFKECGCRFPLWTITERDEEAIDMAIESLKADPVRCGECLHMKAECCDEGTCFYWCKRWENATDSWGWCYYGERREP